MKDFIKKYLVWIIISIGFFLILFGGIFSGIGFLLIIFAGSAYIDFYLSDEARHERINRKEEREAKRIQQEEENKIKKEEEILRLKQAEEDAQREEEVQRVEYQKLRKEIEAIPKYENWKNAVFSKNGMRCEMCGEAEYLEIHHRQSFYSIIKACNIKNTAQAFENNALWDIDNGSVLCKTCHTKMASSKYREQNNL